MANSIEVDGLTYGEHMIRALEIDLAQAKAQLAAVERERDELIERYSSTAKRCDDARQWAEIECDAATLRATNAERERDEIVNAVIGAPQNTAVIATVEQAIASWLDAEAHNLHDAAQRDALPDRAGEWPWVSYETAARAIRAGAYRTRTEAKGDS